MKKAYYLLIFFAITMLGCKEKIPAPTVKFSAEVHTKGQVVFTNQSTDANSYQWDFGDGTGRSTNQNPNYTYAKPGRYTITLKATGAGGDAQAQNTIDIAGVKSTAAFSFTYLTNGEVQFTNQATNADAYNWIFEGNGSSTQKDPKVAFTFNGSYKVTLKVSGFGEPDEVSKTITITNGREPAPIADFSWTESNGVVTFTNKSQFATSYSWDFGDGSTKNTDTNPKYTFKRNQKYNVVLTANGKGGTNAKTGEIEVKNAPLAIPIRIYITAIAIVDLEPAVVNKRNDSEFYVLIQNSSSQTLLRTDNFKGPLKAITTYNLTSTNLPFLIREPSIPLSLNLYGKSSIFSLIDYPIANIGEALKKDSFPIIETITGTNLKYEIILKYEY